jgi:hypothetical protein
MRWRRAAALVAAIAAGIAACDRVVELSPDATPRDRDGGLTSASDALSDGELPSDAQPPGDAP